MRRRLVHSPIRRSVTAVMPTAITAKQNRIDVIERWIERVSANGVQIWLQERHMRPCVAAVMHSDGRQRLTAGPPGQSRTKVFIRQINHLSVIRIKKRLAVEASLFLLIESYGRLRAARCVFRGVQSAGRYPSSAARGVHSCCSATERCLLQQRRVRLLLRGTASVR